MISEDSLFYGMIRFRRRYIRGCEVDEEESDGRKDADNKENGDDNAIDPQPAPLAGGTKTKDSIDTNDTSNNSHCIEVWTEERGDGGLLVELDEEGEAKDENGENQQYDIDPLETSLAAFFAHL